MSNFPTVEIEGKRVKLLKIISEGGYGTVYLVEREDKPGFKMALKKLITQEDDAFKVAMKELGFLQTYCSTPNPHFISYFGSKVVEEPNNRRTFYILLEFGPNGTLFDLMAGLLQKNQRFKEEEIVSLVRAANEGLTVMHGAGLIHCDVKIENLLYFSWEVIKYCDFGSVNNYNIDCSTLPKQQFYGFESMFERQTTLMYRPPEMCDLYLGYKVNCKVDLWMLGCVLFTLMFFKHPFHESSKLAITSAAFYWPDTNPYSEKLENLVRNLLTPNPDFRPSSAEVKALLDNWATIKRVELNPMASHIKREMNIKRGIYPSSPQKPSQQPQTDFQVDARREASRGKSGKPVKDFDFSGLERLSKRQPEKPVNAAQAPKLGKAGSFMNWNFDSSNNKGDPFSNDQKNSVKINSVGSANNLQRFNGQDGGLFGFDSFDFGPAKNSKFERFSGTGATANKAFGIPNSLQSDFGLDAPQSFGQMPLQSNANASNFQEFSLEVREPDLINFDLAPLQTGGTGAQHQPRLEMSSPIGERAGSGLQTHFGQINKDPFNIDFGEIN